MKQDSIKHKEKYGLFTAIAMIVGVCIGSGIFFKSDNILVAAGGSIFLGVVVFVIAAMAIIFGGITVGELASRTSNPGGIVTYADEFLGSRTACGFGWFQTFVYYPTLIAVVSWVVGVYTCILLNLPGRLETQILIGYGFTIICFLFNTLSAKAGGIFQNCTTIIKMIPLLFLAVFGFIYGDPLSGFSNVSLQSFKGSSWIAAIGPIAFSFDGWIVSTSVAHEIKDSKRNMRKALIIAPLFILVLYVIYFVGISSYIGPENVMALGDEHVALAASNLFGPVFAKAVTIFVIISVMGTVNGLILGFIRMPYSMALRRGMMPFSNKLSAMDKKLDMPVNSSLFAFSLVSLWMLVHYITAKYDFLPNSDISEISIAMSYLLYIALYYQVYKMYKNKEITSPLRGLVFPALAGLGSLFILSGGLQNSLFIYYAGFCLLVIILSQIYYNRKEKSS
ncbi:APC family permease [Clostridium polynesiense]|uniref:APC family permease n=1 Tax=Clostridium polynesiense TaxID=1325933 RepID=UPI000591447A|nr:APC family permease [Clostridium polynesiense]